MPAKPLDADAPEPVSSEESPASWTSGVATRENSVAAIRALYAKGDVDGAMALAAKHVQEAERVSPHGPRSRDWSDASVSIQIGPEVDIDVDVSLSGLRHGADSPDASVHVEVASEAVDVSLTGLTNYLESGAIDVSLSGLERTLHPHGADAPDASVHVWVEREAVDVSLTGLEPFQSGAIDVSLSSLVKVCQLGDEPADVSLQGLSGIIDDIESVEPTIGFKKATSPRELLQKQRLLAHQLDAGVALHITMPPPVERPPASFTEEERRSIPRVIKSPSEIAGLPLGPRGGFVLAQIDGMQTIEEILDVSAMSMDEASEIIRHLVSLGVIQLE